MHNWLLFLVAAAIGCSSGGSETTTTGRTSTGTAGSGTGGAGGGTGASGGTGGSAATGGTGGSTGGSGGATGSGGNTGGSGGSTAGSGGSTGGMGGSTGGSAGSTGGSAGSPDAGPDGSGGTAGGDASTRPDATAEEVQSCNGFADAFCNRLQTCSSFVMSVLYGDVATCRQRWVLSCLPNYNVRGTSASAAKTNACAQTLPTLACDNFVLGDFGTMCTPAPGMLAQGAACGDDAQCASTFCARSATSVCGTCQPVTNPGDPCVQGSCSVSTNTVCPAGTSTCVKPKAGVVGDPCVGQEECDVGRQVGCNTATSKRCIALTLTPSGGTCGANSILNTTTVAVCGAGGTCNLPYMGMCTPFAADGQTCSTGDTGAHCVQPAKCVGGRCVVPDPSTCN